MGRGGELVPGVPAVGSVVMVRSIVGVVPGVVPKSGVTVALAVIPGVMSGVPGKMVSSRVGVATIVDPGCSIVGVGVSSIAPSAVGVRSGVSNSGVSIPENVGSGSPGITVKITPFIPINGFGSRIRSTVRYQTVSSGGCLPHPTGPL